MLDYQLDRQQMTEKRPRPALPWWVFAAGGGVLLLAILASNVGGCAGARESTGSAESESAEAPPEAVVIPTPEPDAPPPSAFAHMVLPTKRADLLELPIEKTIQPTNPQRPESGLYGSVRTAQSGGAKFHEGIDIAPVARDRSGRPLDEARAVAHGVVGYVSIHSGNSNYGKYVVVLHQDPVGEVYTLYAHLADVAPGIAAGRSVKAGTVLGRMGDTPPHIVRMDRAHLHFEIGMMANDRFADYMRAKRTRNPHGRYNGWNFLGVNPMTALRHQREAGEAFTFLAHLQQVPVAFELVLPATRVPNVFRRHPGLWEGGDFHGPAVVVSASEGGVPLKGRPATPEEAARIKARKPVVLSADAAVLGRNGRRLVSKTGSGWVLGSQGQLWVDILLF